METLIDYLEREQRTFEELAFTPVDSLVLSSLVYFNFDAAGVVERQSDRLILLHDAVCLTPLGDLVRSSWLEDDALAARFVQAVAASRRLRNVGIAFFSNEVSQAIEKQFSAAAFVLPRAADALRSGKEGVPSPSSCRVAPDAVSDLGPGDVVYLAFRGTDGTLAGWKEDFNLTFKEVIPSQAAARRYVSGVASTCPCLLLVGGHSKGGNLAEFAAMTCDEAVYGRIARVFDHDGPAFFDDPSPRMSSAEYAAKLHKTVPSSSVFGLMLEQRETFSIVESNAAPFLSHAPFTWLVENGDFVYADRLTPGASLFDRSLDEWLHDIDPEKRELFIDTAYELLTSSDASTWAEFQERLPQNIARLVQQGARLDAQTRSFLLRTIAQGVSVFTSLTARSILPERPWFSLWRDALANRRRLNE